MKRSTKENWMIGLLTLSAYAVGGVLIFIMIPLLTFSAYDDWLPDNPLGFLFIGGLVFVIGEIMYLSIGKPLNKNHSGFTGFLLDNVILVFIGLVGGILLIGWMTFIYNFKYIIGNLLGGIGEFMHFIFVRVPVALFEAITTLLSNNVVLIVIVSIASIIGIKYLLYKFVFQRRKR